MLEQEFKYFEDHKDELLKQYTGKFIAIVGTQVVGVFDSELEAYTAMKKDRKAGTFLIQQCSPGEDTRTFHSRVAV
jgi:hypothetical protein